VAPKQPLLIPSADPAAYGDAVEHRHLFLPQFLKSAGEDARLRDAAYEQALAIIRRWADLEARGRLRRMNETTLRPEFALQVFGQALGYTLFSETTGRWDFQFEFPVNSGSADAALGLFEHGQAVCPRAVIEFKGPTVNIDRDRFAGRTPVRQVWDYLADLPQCPWGIVCNYVSFRLFHREHTPRVYEHFALQDLRHEENFRPFYYLFQRGGLLSPGVGQRPRADVLLERTAERQREVGDELYRNYQRNRLGFIRCLQGPPYKKSRDQAIHIAQKLLDRIIFVAFCEDRALMSERTLERVHSYLPPFRRVTNPRWRNFLELFRAVDEGAPDSGMEPFDGGLFRQDDEVDGLQLTDDWTNFFAEVGGYDFRDEINVDVLGHLFERSVGDLERIRRGALIEPETPPEPEAADRARMAKSAERKRGGIYYTPPPLTDFIVRRTVGDAVDERLAAVAARHALPENSRHAEQPSPDLAAYWRDCLDALRTVTVVDPACGSGAFLIRAYDLLEARYQDLVDHLIFHAGLEAEALRDEVPDYILRDNLFGVDLSPQAVEITQLALWIRSARRGKTLADLSRNIVRGNSLVSDPTVDPHALDWRAAFPAVFAREKPGFDCVIGNPPWERMKLQEREFFDGLDQSIAAAVSAADRRKRIAALEKKDPEVHARYLEAKAAAERTLDYVRDCGRFSLTGKGDINTYAVFAELAQTLVAPDGRVGLLVPSGIATDNTTREFFASLNQAQRLAVLYDFENKAPMFPDVHRSYKFCILLFGGPERKYDHADFVFFAHAMADLDEKDRHIALTAKDFRLLNPNTRTCPIFRSRRDAELTKAIYRRVPVLIDHSRKEGGNPWGIRFLTMFHQTNDAELFRMADDLTAAGFKPHDACWRKRKEVCLPLYEAKMIQMYDHRAAEVVINGENWMRQGQTNGASLVQHQNPEYFGVPRWWVSQSAVAAALEGDERPAYLAYKDVTSATNQRTMIAAFIPLAGVLNSAPLILTGEKVRVRSAACLLANLNAFALDFAARQKVGGVHLNYFIVEQFPIFPPVDYARRCPWRPRQTLERWISDRVLTLTCTANDMRPLAEAAGFDPPVHKWDPAERAELMAELDAAYFLLYGLDRDDAAYVLSTFQGVRDPDPALLPATSTYDRVLAAYDRFAQECQVSSAKWQVKAGED
jgi:hypothetical protein